MTFAEIGRLLREGRQRKGWTLYDVQRATKIRMKYLEAIEAGNDEALPPEVYTKGFIRTYANLLDLDGLALARAYSRWKRTQGGQEASPTDDATAPDQWGRPEDTAEADTPPAEPEGQRGRARSLAHEQRTEPLELGEPGTRFAPTMARGPSHRERSGRAAADRARTRQRAREPEAASRWEEAQEEPALSEPPLIPPLAPVGRGRRRGTTPGLRTKGGHARRWSRLATVAAVLILLVAAALYAVGGPESASEELPEVPPAPGSAEQPREPAAPGGSPSESENAQQEPEAPPADLEVTLRRDGDDLHYTIARPAGSGPAAGSPGTAQPPLSQLLVRLSATDRVWVRVRSSAGDVLLERLMVPGDRQELPLGEGLQVRVGYPRGLALQVGTTAVDIPPEQSPLNLWLEPVEGNP